MGIAMSALDIIDVSKSYPGVQALRNVSMRIESGEVHALLGENGAGKSKLMKIIAGAVRKDHGTIRIDGREVEIEGPQHAAALGIAIIYQELTILPQVSVAENIFLGRLPRSRRVPWLVDWKRCNEEAAILLGEVGLSVDPQAPASRLKVAGQQMVEIAKALSQNARYIIMDEPTASLAPREVETLFGVVEKLRKRGVGVIYISHRLSEVESVCARATILRDGCKVGSVDVATTKSHDWVRMMVGRELDRLYPPSDAAPGAAILSVQNVSNRKLKNVSLTVHSGEILGVGGLVGSGRSTLARTLAGAQAMTSGEMLIDGSRLRCASAKDAIDAGVALVPEDRKGEGLVLDLSIRENITLPNLRGLMRLGRIDRRLERAVSARYVNQLRVPTPSVDKRVANLSGGNQQKIVLAKWLYANVKVLIVDEPTRGIDVGAKAEIYQLLRSLVREGMAVVVVSSELPELLGMSDRIIVMREGRISGELSREEFSEENIMAYASGLSPSSMHHAQAAGRVS